MVGWFHMILCRFFLRSRFVLVWSVFEISKGRTLGISCKEFPKDMKHGKPGSDAYQGSLKTRRLVKLEKLERSGGMP